MGGYLVDRRRKYPRLPIAQRPASTASPEMVRAVRHSSIPLLERSRIIRIRLPGAHSQEFLTIMSKLILPTLPQLKKDVCWKSIMSTSTLLHILVVEDSRGDAVLLTRAFLRVSADIDITLCLTAEDAAQAIACGKRDFDLFITDINLPGMSGINLLQRLSETKVVEGLPAIVLTSSAASADVDAAFQTDICGYVVKPYDSVEYERIARSLVNWWRAAQSLFPALRCSSLVDAVRALPTAISSQTCITEILCISN